MRRKGISCFAKDIEPAPNGRPNTPASESGKRTPSTNVPMNTQAQGRVSILNRRDFVQSGPNGSTPKRVLMADPDTSLPVVYREPLLREGFELGTAVNGLECVARLRECVPDVLVLEPHIPWGGGDGILAIMGESPELAMIPVMILTSCRDRDVLNAVERFPINDYHVKPLAPDRLAGRLRSFVDLPLVRFTLGDHNGRLECAIALRTGGRIWDLRVEVCGGRVIVHGRSDSYYIKQLALAAVLEAFEALESRPETVELEIEVAPADNWRSRRGASTRRGGDE